MFCNACLAENTDNAIECSVCGASLLDSDDNNATINSSLYHLSPGTILHREYRIEKVLGQGGFGITYKAEYLPNGTIVAIKELWPGGARQGDRVSWPLKVTPQERKEQIKKFEDEARNQQQCNHPNIAIVYDCFQENNTVYMALEFISGKSLADIGRDEGNLAEDRVKRYFIQIADALRVVHQNKFQHRDIKPDNILINEQDRAVLIDFGAAREFIAGKTQQMSVILTPGYAPPEQYSPMGQRYAATDFYAFCASMYELLTGEFPVDAVCRMRHTSDPSIPPSDPLIPPRQLNSQISELMENVILIGMKIVVEERFQQAQDLIDALNGTLISPLQRKAQELVKRGRLVEAAQIYHKCLTEDTSNGNAAVEYALLLVHLNDPEALAFAQMATQLKPNDARAYGVLGLLYCRQGEWTEAVNHLKLAGRLAHDRAWIYTNLAWALGKSGNWKEAETTVATALSLDPNAAFALGIQAWIAYQFQIYKPQFRGQVAAIPAATQAITRSKSAPTIEHRSLQQWLYPYLLTALAKTTNPLSSVSLNSRLEDCLAQIPDCAFALGFKGWQQAQIGAWNLALSYFQAASQSTNPQSWSSIDTAIVLEHSQDIPQAIQMYKTCIQNISVPFIHYRLGTLLAQQHQWAQAQTQLESAIELHRRLYPAQEYAQAYHNLGWVLLNHHDTKGELLDVRGMLTAYEMAIQHYHRQNRHDLAQQLEQTFQDAEIDR
jgi:eukaryotic-like serine/threonine-protein kinase